MIISDRLRALREQKNLSQGDIEKRTGLLRCYISRIENGHTVPAVETLEKFARALNVPIYQLFHDGASPITKPKHTSKENDELWGSETTERAELKLFAKALSKMSNRSRNLLMATALTFA